MIWYLYPKTSPFCFLSGKQLPDSFFIHLSRKVKKNQDKIVKNSTLTKDILLSGLFFLSTTMFFAVGLMSVMQSSEKCAFSVSIVFLVFSSHIRSLNITSPMSSVRFSLNSLFLTKNEESSLLYWHTFTSRIKKDCSIAGRCGKTWRIQQLRNSWAVGHRYRSSQWEIFATQWENLEKIPKNPCFHFFTT